MDVLKPIQLQSQSIIYLPHLLLQKLLSVQEIPFHLEQLFEFVSVKVYELVEVGDTEGFATVELKPGTVLIQAYLLPVTFVLPMETVEPIQMAVFGITEAAGKALIVIVTELLLEHPLTELSHMQPIHALIMLLRVIHPWLTQRYYYRFLSALRGSIP